MALLGPATTQNLVVKLMVKFAVEFWWKMLLTIFPSKRSSKNLLPNFAGSSPPISPKTSPTSLWKSLVLKFPRGSEDLPHFPHFRRIGFEPLISKIRPDRLYYDRPWVTEMFLKFIGHARPLRYLSQNPGRSHQKVCLPWVSRAELFGPHPFKWKTPPHRKISGPKSLS